MTAVVAAVMPKSLSQASLLVVPVALLLVSCSESSQLAPMADTGTTPVIVPPVKTQVPTVHIAPARGWAAGEKPLAAKGLRVDVFAAGLEHPRWLFVLPNGDVLVAETNAPAKETKGLQAWLMNRVMTRAGARAPSGDRISLLRDADGDGVAEQRSVFLQGLHSPFGMTLIGNTLYVAHADSLWQYRYAEGATEIREPGTRVLELPAGRNHHWTKNVVAAPDGKRLYITVGSNSNVAEHGMQEEQGRAAIWVFDRATGSARIFASGLRNPNGLDFEPSTGTPWTVVNERDELGSDLVPDYLTSVRDGGFYGWPYSYFGRHIDDRVQPPRPDLVARAIVPDYALGAHVAPLGLAFVPLKTAVASSGDGSAGPAKGSLGLPPHYSEGAFIGEHGSWNRRPLNGYKVVFVAFKSGQPVGLPTDVLSGFVDVDGQARGRPVGVALDRRGALLVADDVGNIVWRVRASSPEQP